jgi:PAS domain S-box-containing protein
MSEGHHSTDAEQYRRRLYEVLSDGTLSLEERIVAALDVGRQYLGVENGHVTRIDRSAEEQVILLSTDEGAGIVPEGEPTPLSRTYCRTTIERDAPLAMSDVPAEPGWDERYREHGLACYLGVELTVDGETFGTLCFVDREVRERSFSEMERSFAELLARSVERELEVDRYESQLDGRREELAARERRLERSERKYESLVETAPDAIVLVDADTGELVEVNASMAELTGYEESELVGRDGRTMLVAGGEAGADDGVETSTIVSLVEADAPMDRLSDGTPIRVRRRDGDPVPVEVSADRVELDGKRYVQAVVRDVRERRERERELRLKDRAIEEAQVGVTIAAAGDGTNPLEYVNPEFCRLTGYDRDEVVGRDCRMLQGERTGEGPVAAMAAAIRAEESVQEELLNYRADGTPFWNEVTVTPVRDRQGEVTHFVGFQQDVTDRKRRETLVSVLNRVLRHNLRNDMTVVRGHANLLQGGEGNVDVADSATTIAETADELVELSEKAQTLEQVAADPGELRRIDPHEVTASVADRVRDAYPGADVDVAVADSVPAVVATGRLERALFEILENAAAHAGEAPSVCLSVSHAEADERVSIRIEDDGPGLASNERAVLDGRSETPLEHGTGLGLWLANWIVTGLGGELEVVDSETSGTTVDVRLPAVSPRATGWESPIPSAIGLDD